MYKNWEKENGKVILNKSLKSVASICTFTPFTVFWSVFLPALHLKRTYIFVNSSLKIVQTQSDWMRAFLNINFQIPSQILSCILGLHFAFFQGDGQCEPIFLLHIIVHKVQR